MWSGCNLKGPRWKTGMVSMLSGSDDGLGGGLSCPEKDRCTNYSCALDTYINLDPSVARLTHPWWWRQYAPLKRRSTIILHGSISQKTALNSENLVFLSLCIAAVHGYIYLCVQVVLSVRASYAVRCYVVEVVTIFYKLKQQQSAECDNVKRKA
jgi:hypothetical protein